MAEKQDSQGRLPYAVYIMKPDGSGYVDFGGETLSPAELAAALSLVAEDSAHVNTGQLGYLMMAVRHDVLTTLESTDGDHSPLIVDQYGRTKIAPGYHTNTLTVASGQSLSGEFDTTSRSVAGIIMPAAWTAAVLTFQGTNVSGSGYSDVYDDNGNEVTVQAAASRAIGIDAAALGIAPWRYGKLRSGTTGSPVVQAADRSIIVIFKGT